MAHEPVVGQEVNANDNFLENDIVVDCDGEPWRYFAGRWSSTWSARNGINLAGEFGETNDTITMFGLTTHQLMVTKVGYGPFMLIWRAK